MVRRLVVDYENNAEVWWDAARADLAHCPESVRPLLDVGGLDEVTVNDDDTEAFLAWAESLPGWDDQANPDYAQAPILVYSVDDFLKF